MKTGKLTAAALGLCGIATIAGPGQAATFTFSSGDPDGQMASASRPEVGDKQEAETGDDFVLPDAIKLTGSSFYGLVPDGAVIKGVTVEIYRVFPKDSDVGRTSGAPTFSTDNVPTRVNSPSDVAFVERSSGSGGLSFATTDLGSFTANNSVAADGINPKPNQTTGGNGPVTGREVRFDLSYLIDLLLPADHYFFVPQVDLGEEGGDFYWLSSPKPIVPPGTPFLPDLQGWARNEALDPDWLRIGTDIVGGTQTFNFAFSLDGETVAPVPLPASLPLLALAVGGLALVKRRRA